MSNFHQILHNEFTPHLKSINYTYSKDLRYTGNWMYDNEVRARRLPEESMHLEGYQKRLDQMLYCVFVQRQQDNDMVASGFRFTINFSVGYSIKSKFRFGIPSYRNNSIASLNIGQILRTAYHLKHFTSQYWWVPNSEDELVQSMRQASEYIVKFAIPWIESKKLIHLPSVDPEEKVEFCQNVYKECGKRMENLGYSTFLVIEQTIIVFSRIINGYYVDLLVGFGYDKNGFKSFDVLILVNSSKILYNDNIIPDADILKSDIGSFMYKNMGFSPVNLKILVDFSYESDIEFSNSVNKFGLLIEQYIDPFINSTTLA